MEYDAGAVIKVVEYRAGNRRWDWTWGVTGGYPVFFYSGEIIWQISTLPGVSPPPISHPPVTMMVYYR